MRKELVISGRNLNHDLMNLDTSRAFLQDIGESLGEQLAQLIEIKQQKGKIDPFQLGVLREKLFLFASKQAASGDIEAALSFFEQYLVSQSAISTQADLLSEGIIPSNVVTAIRFINDYDPERLASLNLRDEYRESKINPQNPGEKHEKTDKVKSILSCVDSARFFLQIGNPEAAIKILETLQAYHDEHSQPPLIQLRIARAIFDIQIDIAYSVVNNKPLDQGSDLIIPQS